MPGSRLLSSPRSEELSILSNLLHCGNLRAVRELFADSRIDSSGWDNAAIYNASTNKHAKMVKALLENERGGFTKGVLASASYNGHLKIVRELLKDDKVNPSAE